MKDKGDYRGRNERYEIDCRGVVSGNAEKDEERGDKERSPAHAHAAEYSRKRAG